MLLPGTDYYTVFRRSSDHLCNAIASVAKRICTIFVDPRDLYAYTACRLIAIDKNPGVCPIGIGEVLHRIIGKVILDIIRPDIFHVTGSIQLCTGQIAGAEAAVHTVSLLFDDESSEATLLIDASNAFNNLNRQVTLRNFLSICPALATVAINLYRDSSSLFIDGECLLSKEGVMQRDPLAMAIYAVGVMPLIKKLDIPNSSNHQIWFADDAAATGSFEALYTWLKKWIEIGPQYGYHVNCQKTCLLVKNPENLARAKSIFLNSGITITTEAQRHLGAWLGNKRDIDNQLKKGVNEWVNSIHLLSEIANCHPHAAYSAFMHGIMSQWLYSMRTSLCLSDHLQPLEDVIRSKLIPSILGREVSDFERELLALPIQQGGLGIIIPTKIANDQYTASKEISQPLIDSIIKRGAYDDNISTSQQQAKLNFRGRKMLKMKADTEELMRSCTHIQKRCLEMAQEKGASSWLSALPIKSCGFALHKTEFRGTICLQYNWTPERLPTQCACGESFSITHAMDCHCGGFPTRRHNEIHDITVEMMSQVCHNVIREPQLQPLSGETFSYASTNFEDGARSDICVPGFWGNQYQRAFFDVRVCNPNAQSYCNSSLKTVYGKQEREKRKTYEERIREVEMGSFTPLIFSIYGGMSKCTETTYKRLASLLAEKRGDVITWIRCRLSFSLTRSAISAIRGSRSQAPINYPQSFVFSSIEAQI